MFQSEYGFGGSMPFNLAREREHLIEYWSRLFLNKRGRLDLNAAPVRRLFGRKNSTAMDVRKLHDAFGWCAKKPKLCAGAIYRTEAFMAVDPTLRDASKPRGVLKAAWPRNIHIEHTVLASQLHEMWLKRSPADATDILFFVSYGIATAMHASEEDALGHDYHTINPCFAEGPAKGLPFLRYGKLPVGTIIRNVFTGQPIDIQTYSFDDHHATVRALLKEVGAPQQWIDAVQIGDSTK